MIVRRALTVLGVVFVLLGTTLLSLNLAGSLPHSHSSSANPRIFGGGQDLLTGDLTRRRREAARAYATRLTQSVYLRMRHAWKEHNRPAITENWPLWTQAAFLSITGARYQRGNYYRAREWLDQYEYVNYRHALDRGYGLCSQFSLVVADVLRRQGIPVRIQRLDGHVVAEARIDSDAEETVLDADYGVAIPGGMRRIRSHPSIIAAVYSRSPRILTPATSEAVGGPSRRATDPRVIRASYSRVPRTGNAENGDVTVPMEALIRRLESIYAPPNYATPINAYDRFDESHAYMIKWLVPLLLLTTGSLLLVPRWLSQRAQRKARDPSRRPQSAGDRKDSYAARA